MDNSVMYKFKM